MPLFEDNPSLYDAAFGLPRTRGFRSVIDMQGRFIERVCRFHNSSIKRVAELAAGPGYHATWFAQRNYEVVAIDKSRPMVSFCRQRARDLAVNLKANVDDLRSLSTLRETDLMLLLFDSVRLLSNNEDIRRHLVAVGNRLAREGLYVVEFAHPKDQLGSARTVRNRWRTNYNGANVQVSWETCLGSWDSQTQLAVCRVAKVGKRRPFAVAHEKLRIVLPQDFHLSCKEIAGLTLIAQYGAFSANIGINAPAAWRTLQVYQR